MTTKKSDLREKVTQLRQISSGDESAELSLLFNAMVNTRTAYAEEPTAARKKDYDAAREGLNELIQKIEAAYADPNATTTTSAAYDPASVLFRNSSEMYDHLKDQGWGLSSRQTLTNHAKKGTLRLSIDRSISVDAFNAWKNHPEGGLRYYEAYTKHKRETLGTIEDNALKKSNAEAEQAAIKARKMAREEEMELGRIISREAADIEVCAWAAYLRDAILHRVTQALPSLIHAVSGQQAAQPEAQAIIDNAIEKACNDVANSGEINVEIEAIEGEDES